MPDNIPVWRTSSDIGCTLTTKRPVLKRKRPNVSRTKNTMLIMEVSDIKNIDKAFLLTQILSKSDEN